MCPYFHQKIAFSEEVLKNIAFERENSTVMKDLEDVYKRQDEAILKLRTALVEFYNYELQVRVFLFSP